MGYASYSSVVFRCYKLWYLFFKFRKLFFICFFELIPLLFYPEETYSYKESKDHNKIDIFVSLYFQYLEREGGFLKF
jgi:hypothetical protein